MPLGLNSMVQSISFSPRPDSPDVVGVEGEVFVGPGFDVAVDEADVGAEVVADGGLFGCGQVVDALVVGREGDAGDVEFVPAAVGEVSQVQ